MAEHEEIRARVEHALGQVPEPFRTTLILRDIEGFAYEEVAAMQGVNLGTVKSRLVRGRACLKALLMEPKPGSQPSGADRDRFVPGRGGAMNGCNQMQAGFTEYLDGRLNGREMQEIDAHLQDCRECAQEWKSLRECASLAGGLGPVPEPADLPLAHSRRSQPGAGAQPPKRLHCLGTGLEKYCGTVSVQASAGFASAVLSVGDVVIVLVTVLAQPEMAQATPDEPLGMPPLLVCSIFQRSGRRRDGRPSTARWWLKPMSTMKAKSTISALSPVPPTPRPALRWRICCFFSRFEPARFFGQPVRGLAVLSFAGISVRG